MSYQCCAAKDLDAATCERWESIRHAGRIYRSPFFSPYFVQTVSHLAPDIEVGIARRNDVAVAFFPFQRFRGSIARPVGVGINDAHGLIANRGEDISLRDVMAHCGLKTFPFHASPLESSDILQHEVGRTRAFLADLTVDPLGYEHFLKSNSQTIEKQAQKTRRMVRELGELRFEFDCRDPQMLQRLVDLKSAQYRRTHIFDILGVPWIRLLLNDLIHNPAGQLRDTQANSTDFGKHRSARGILNVLYAGETPVALHYGMTDGDLIHYWFPVFDPRFAFGSPGTQLFLEVAREGRSRGYTAIDMGYGEQEYKYKLTNVITEMSFGIVTDSLLSRRWYVGKRTALAKLKQLKIKETIKPMARRLLPGFGRSQYEA
ncbi:MAG: GNAT family N-acetyltransferase [Pirellulaceae bacterium]